MKKHIYLLLPLLTLHPTLATQKVVNSLIIASTLVLSHSSYDKKLSLDLHQAVEQNNNTNALQLITNPQVDINAKVDYGTLLWDKGWTPLIWCCREGNQWLPIAQALLKHQYINVNLRDNDGWTPLFWCAYSGQKSLHITQALLKHQYINVNLQDNDGWTPLFWCAYSGDKSLKIAQALLKDKHINVNLQEKDGWTPLMMCAYRGDKWLPIAQELLKHKHINVNLQKNDGWTPLLVCCQEGKKSLHIAQALLKHKDINVNLQDNDGWTPLMMCAYRGDKWLPIAQALLKDKHINVNLKNNSGRTPLDIMIYWIKKNKENYKYVQLWNLLVQQGAVLNIGKVDYENLKPSDFKEPRKGYVRLIKQNPPQNNPFMIISLKLSSLTQENERLRKQLDHKNNTINKLKDQTQRLTNQLAIANKLKDKQQQTLQQQIPQDFLSQKYTMQNPLLTLHPTLATQKIITSTIIASTLVLSHSSYDKKLSLDLHQAVEQNNNTNALQLITNPQVDINAKVDYGTLPWDKGRTPLIHCAYKGHDALPIAQELLKHQYINVNLQDNFGRTPLFWCAYSGDKSLHIAQALLKDKHINVNLQDKVGWTPLIWCAYNGDKSLKIAQALLKHKYINVNLQTNDGWTPLIRCCRTGDDALQIAQALLKRKDINVNLQEENGWTPLIMCCFEGDKSLPIAQALLKHKDINVNLQDEDGRTPLDNIIYWIKLNLKNYKYVQLWNLLVAQGAVLNKHRTDYHNLNPPHFQDPHTTYIHLIKQNPPKN